MPSKASSNGQGSDVYPQFLNAMVQETAANTFTQKEYATPNLGIGASPSGKPVIMEVLKIFFATSTPELIAATVTNITVQLTKQSQSAILALTDVSLLAKSSKNVTAVGARTNEATGVIPDLREAEVIDLQAADGKGYLYPWAKLYIGVKGTNNAAVKVGYAKIMYRMKEVSAEELLGLTSESSA